MRWSAGLRYSKIENNLNIGLAGSSVTTETLEQGTTAIVIPSIGSAVAGTLGTRL